jgi:cell division protein FtsQ
VTEAVCAAVIKTENKLYDVDTTLFILSAGEARCQKVPVVSGLFKIDGRQFKDAKLSGLFAQWPLLITEYSALYARISEIQLKSDGRLYIFTAHPRFRIEMNGTLNREDLYRLHSTMSYLEKEGLKSGIIDLRGRDAVIVPEQQ